MNKFYVLLFTLLCLLVTACSSTPLLTNMAVTPETISPRPGEKNRATLITYALARPANVSVYLQDANGKYVLRENQPRAAGDFQILFGGSV
ncbi:hypothetical protein FBQ82_21955, partial [Anaerolineae bacterium CFX7]|nr:hypothetical protein [Anaerolineae bacterium CFX7]